MLAVPGSGGFSVLLMQKQGREYSPETKEDEYKKQYHPRSRILIVDDEPSFVRLLQLVLERTGRYSVRKENDATKALEVAKEFHPDRFYGKAIGEYAKKLSSIFQAVKAAFELLSDEKRRAAYLDSLR